MKRCHSCSVRRGQQAGVMLIEALIALLIFSLGVLGIVGLQSTAVKISGDSRYRSEAALLANELIGRMWADDHTATNLQANYDSTVNGTVFQKWAWQGYGNTAGTQTAPAAGTVYRTLPGARTYPPVVTVNPVSRTVAGAGGAVVTVTTAQVTVTIKWQAPSDSGDGAVHSYMAVAQIGG